LLSLVQGYSSTDMRTSLLNDWDLQEIGSSEVSEVVSCFDFWLVYHITCCYYSTRPFGNGGKSSCRHCLLVFMHLYWFVEPSNTNANSIYKVTYFLETWTRRPEFVNILVIFLFSSICRCLPKSIRDKNISM
jgi:hypothetical protein